MVHTSDLTRNMLCCLEETYLQIYKLTKRLSSRFQGARSMNTDPRLLPPALILHPHRGESFFSGSRITCFLTRGDTWPEPGEAPQKCPKEVSWALCLLQQFWAAPLSREKWPHSCWGGDFRAEIPGVRMTVIPYSKPATLLYEIRNCKERKKHALTFSDLALPLTI